MIRTNLVCTKEVCAFKITHYLSQWIERVVGWLGKVFLQDNPTRPTSPEAGNTLRRWRCHVQRFFYRIYASLRIEELFSIIRGWSCRDLQDRPSPVIPSAVGREVS